MRKILNTGKYKSENINDKTTFFYPNQGETLTTFFNRVCNDIKNAPPIYGSRFVAVIDGILIDIEDFYNKVVQNGGNPVEAFERIKVAKKEVDEKYGITTEFKHDSRKITVLEQACAGKIDLHHAEVADFAKQHANKHYIVTSSHMGIYDADQLMKLSEDQIKQYITETYDQTHSIMYEYYSMGQFNSQLDGLLTTIINAPEAQQKNMLEKLLTTITEKTEKITPIAALKNALKQTSMDRANAAANIEISELDPEKKEKTKDD